ncbi:MAG: membrane protein insertase YidC [Bacteroidales bacterium]|nr:membrane protein insertase YidC [Bacteroidales bacterium]
MDKKSIIGLVLIFLLFFGYIKWVTPSREEIEKSRIEDSRIEDSVRRAEQAEKEKTQAAKNDTTAVTDTTKNTVAANINQPDSVVKQQENVPEVKTSKFKTNFDNPSFGVSVQNNLFKVDLQTLGASVQSVVLKDYSTFDNRPLEIITPNKENFTILFDDVDGKEISTSVLPFALYCGDKQVTTASELIVPENDSLTLSFRAYVCDDALPIADKYLEFRYVFYHDSYEIDFDVKFHNINNYVKERTSLNVIWNNKMNRQEKSVFSKASRMGEQNYTSIYYKSQEDKPDWLREGNDGSVQLTTPVEWVAYKQQFFCAILMTENQCFHNAQQLNMAFDKNQSGDPTYLCDMSSILGYSYDASNSDFVMDMRLFYGPNKYRLLRGMDRDFERMLPLGWGFFLTQWVSRYAIIPVFNLLENFGWNYGIIIIVLTFLLKLVLSPLTYKSYKSGAVMRHLKPEMEAINKKFPKQEQALQKQQAMSALNKKAGISPLAGCLPALIQFPILIAMYRFYPASIELRQQSFLWCDDLSSFDSILNLPFNIPIYGSHVSLFCLLMFGMQFFYTVYTMKQQQGQASMPGMKFMMYFMPFMMLFIFNSQSAALNIYYFFNLLLSMAQMFAIRAFITEDKVRARIAKSEAMSKTKPQKKSRFQQRLEEMQRMSEEMQKQRQNQNKR